MACGQCLACRVNRRRIWQTRMELELRFHECASFVTLTYAPEHYPSDSSVKKRDLQLFLKRLRFAVEPAKIRYFAVGEYGEKSGRAHYHAVLYGVPMTDQKLIADSWGLGLVHVGEANTKTMGYIAGYVTKKLTRKDDPRLAGREPEFGLCSRKPGIGLGFVELAACELMTEKGSAGLAAKGDVPSTVRLDGKEKPLGRYIRESLRKAVGAESGNTPPEAKARWIAEMQALREDKGPAAFVGAVTDWARSDRAIRRLIQSNNRRSI